MFEIQIHDGSQSHLEHHVEVHISSRKIGNRINISSLTNSISLINFEYHSVILNVFLDQKGY